MEHAPILALVGPTASGKSTLAVRLATERGGEIVGCDSVQVYRGFDIGSAKPTRDEQAQVPHHLIDVVCWDEPFDAQRYRDAATTAIAAIYARGRVPIVCGGTGLYLRALRWGLVHAPGSDRALRASLYAEEERTPGALYERLRWLDRASAEAIDPHNIVRLVRALEITILSGQPASALRTRHGFAEEQVPMAVVALDWPPATLRERVAERTAAMLRSGLLDEVESLLASGVSPTARPMLSVGYREATRVVLGQEPRAGLEDRMARATLSYARRQRTWLRRERGVQWVRVRSSAEAWEGVRRALNPAVSRAMP
jgi:tRNA dimethylallyltransferase